MLVRTIGTFDTYEEAYTGFEALYKEMELVLEELGLRMIQEFRDGFSCQKTNSGNWLASFNPASDARYFDKLQNLAFTIGDGVCSK